MVQDSNDSATQSGHDNELLTVSSYLSSSVLLLYLTRLWHYTHWLKRYSDVTKLSRTLSYWRDMCVGDISEAVTSHWAGD